jgi:hypothetical protein
MPVSELQRMTFAVHGYVLVLILAIVEDVAGSLGGTNEILDVGPIPICPQEQVIGRY